MSIYLKFLCRLKLPFFITLKIFVYVLNIISNISNELKESRIRNMLVLCLLLLTRYYALGFIYGKIFAALSRFIQLFHPMILSVNIWEIRCIVYIMFKNSNACQKNSLLCHIFDIFRPHVHWEGQEHTQERQLFISPSRIVLPKICLPLCLYFSFVFDPHF